MIDFLSMSISNGILISLLITVLVFFCLYIYSDNIKLKEENKELRKENRSLLEKKIIAKENVDSISINNISNEVVKQDDRLNMITKVDNSKVEYKLNNIIDKNTNLDELVNKKDKVLDNKVQGNNYLKEISSKINEEIKPQTIELTEYEKKQEEQAVISYSELLKIKDNDRYNEKQETMNFIEELKNLRNSLK